jgi:hypothetical protein
VPIGKIIQENEWHQVSVKLCHYGVWHGTLAAYVTSFFIRLKYKNWALK